jgi:hypothetical protein
MDMIKRTGIIRVSEWGEVQEIVMRFQGLRLQKVESAEVPLRYKTTHYVNIYKDLVSLMKK